MRQVLTNVLVLQAIQREAQTLPKAIDRAESQTGEMTRKAPRIELPDVIGDPQARTPSIDRLDCKHPGDGAKCLQGCLDPARWQALDPKGSMDDGLVS